MDNPSDGPENPDYQQYLDSDIQKTAKQRKKRIVFIIAGALTLLIATVVLVAVLGRQKEPLPEPAQAVIISCKDEACFTDSFLSCSPASYEHSEKNAQVRYIIKESGEIGCIMEVEYLGGSYIADGAGKKMTCDFDNNIDLRQSSLNAFTYPDDYDCKGELADIFKSFANTAEQE